MIEISSQAFSASRTCEKALSLEYYDMLTEKKPVESQLLGALGMLCETSPVALADLKCQFPNHESLLANIRTCAKLVLRKFLPGGGGRGGGGGLGEEGGGLQEVEGGSARMKGSGMLWPYHLGSEQKFSTRTRTSSQQKA